MATTQFQSPTVDSKPTAQEALYAYVGSGATVTTIDGLLIVDRGLWTSTAVYNQYDKVTYQGADILARQQNSGTEPSLIFEATFTDVDHPRTLHYSLNWSEFVIVVNKRFTYSLCVHVPIPFAFLNIQDLIGKFILPALSKLGIPQAIGWLVTNIQKLLGNILDDVRTLIRAIPEAAVLIIVKVGDIVVLNIHLSAEKVPFVVPLPTFILNLPNLAADIQLAIPFPVPPPIRERIPIPDPVLPGPILPAIPAIPVSISGSAGLAPVPISNPVKLPTI